MEKVESFTARYKLEFNETTNEWSFTVAPSYVKRQPDGSYEIRLPAYASYAMMPSGNLIRTKLRKYRATILDKQNHLCVICGKGKLDGVDWILDHQPPMSKPGSRFIDYEGCTKNRVIHRSCDADQNKRRTTNTAR